MPFVIILIAFVWFKKYKPAPKMFINSEGQLVKRSKRKGEDMIDEKFFDETVAENEEFMTSSTGLGSAGAGHPADNNRSSALLMDYDDDTVTPNKPNNAAATL